MSAIALSPSLQLAAPEAHSTIRFAFRLDGRTYCGWLRADVFCDRDRWSFNPPKPWDGIMVSVGQPIVQVKSLASEQQVGIHAGRPGEATHAALHDLRDCLGGAIWGHPTRVGDPDLCAAFFSSAEEIEAFLRGVFPDAPQIHFSSSEVEE